MRAVGVLCLAVAAATGAWRAPAAPACCAGGWQARADEASANTDAIVWDTSGDGIHVQMGGLHAIFWRPGDAERGQYEVSAQFTQNG
ncbi:MAG TPA: hypothetical protein VJ957_06765, partial [Longimicrobiales bacterium]|nr:hypothetical protein [Longimicrobiales bacterium]